MKNKNIYILIIIIFSIFLYSCQTAKDAFQGKKRSEQSDEFLVEKKNPLALPPDYDKLPVPGNKEESNINSEQTSNIKKIINLNEDNEIESDPIDNSGLEDSILEKIQ
tara:strand:- start:159 stop:482 length:324 start_codon:yes stop_codon:yes gene_type:complete